MDERAALAKRVLALGRETGLDAVGIAPAATFSGTRQTLIERRAAGLSADMAFTYRNPQRSTDPSASVPGARSLVVGARSYRRGRPAPDTSETGPKGRVARYSWSDSYAPLRRALEVVAVELRAEGWRAVVVADDNALVDREAAFRAGLGWYGKNTMLLLDGHGSEFVLGSVVTDAPLPPTRDPNGAKSPSEAADDGCGPCTRCLPACPTGALTEPGVLDARRCLAWLVQARGVFPAEHRIALGGRVYGCDECQDVCPPNRLEIRRQPPPAAQPDGDQAEVDLLAILEEPDDDVLLGRYGRWYIADRQARHLRRNALLALGNVADGRNARVGHVLAACLADADPLIRAHAVWAAGRLGRADLVEAMAGTETDAQVLAELGAVPTPRTS